MEREEALDRMHEIQRIVERTTLCTLLPGWPSIIGGALGLAGCLINYLAIGSLDFVATFDLPAPRQLALLAMWAGIAGIAVMIAVVMMSEVARRQGLDPLARPTRLVLLSISPTIAVAMILTVKFMMDAPVAFMDLNAPTPPGGVASDLYIRPAGWPTALYYIVPVWLMCYGLGVYSAGLFSVRAPRILGLAFVLLGALGLLYFAHYGLVLIALGFGLFHVLFGLVVIFKIQRGLPA